jgi:probable rRNA maturation factor
VIEVEVFGATLVPESPSRAEVQRLCLIATAAMGVDDGHLAIEYVGAGRIAALNGEYRGLHEPTDVLSFPIDGVDDIPGSAPEMDGDEGGGSDDDRSGNGSSEGQHPDAGPRELGDVMICPEHTADLREAIVHGVLHLLGMDHETDDGEMLALQARLLDREAT